MNLNMIQRENYFSNMRMHEYKEPVIIIAHFAELLKKNTSEISQNKRLD